MKNLLALTALGLMAFNGVANAAFENRADCMKAVVEHCNTLAHPQPCADSGTSQCKKKFKKIGGSQSHKLNLKSSNNRKGVVFGKSMKIRN